MDISERMQEFIRSHADDDVNALRLRYAGKKTAALDFDLNLALIQIEARRKARKKLPSFIGNERFIFPTLLSEEQASNEAVARYHASLVASRSPILDLTAGLGIDDFEFAKSGLYVTSCEIDPLKCEALRHNADILGLRERIKVENCDSIEYLQGCSGKFDVIFADPARRSSTGNRVHALADCRPDIMAHMNMIHDKAPRLIVKASPLLDISLIRNTVDNLVKIHLVCFRGECKEVLMEISPDKIYEGITVVDIDWETVISRFDFVPVGDPECLGIRYFTGKDPSHLKYIYEPNAGIMKAAEWQSLCRVFPELEKCAPNTHIFLSDTLYPDFPGRVLEILSKPDKKDLKGFKGARFNVVARNHPLTAPEICRKYGIISGGSDYLYAFRCGDTPCMIIARPLTRDQV